VWFQTLTLTLGSVLGAELGALLALGCELGIKLGALLLLGDKLGCEVGATLTLGRALGAELGALLRLGISLGAELGWLLKLGAALILGEELGSLLALGAGLTVGGDVEPAVGCDVGLVVGCDVGLVVGCDVSAFTLLVSPSSLDGELLVSWHVPSRLKLPISLTQFPLQHCRSRKQYAPPAERLQSLLRIEILGVSPSTIDLHFLWKINPAQFPLQQWESTMHVCPPSLLPASHSPVLALYPLVTLLSELSPLHLRALGSLVNLAVDSLESAMIDTTRSINDADFIVVIVIGVVLPVWKSENLRFFRPARGRGLSSLLVQYDWPFLFRKSFIECQSWSWNSLRSSLRPLFDRVLNYLSIIMHALNDYTSMCSRSRQIMAKASKGQ
jgi:hypothetical protein